MRKRASTGSRKATKFGRVAERDALERNIGRGGGAGARMSRTKEGASSYRRGGAVARGTLR
jgi:hypothetical protein